MLGSGPAAQGSAALPALGTALTFVHPRRQQQPGRWQSSVDRSGTALCHAWEGAGKDPSSLLDKLLQVGLPPIQIIQ